MLARGYEFLPIKLGESQAKKYAVVDGKIRLPYMSLKGVGETAAMQLEKACKDNSEFLSVEDFQKEAEGADVVIMNTCATDRQFYHKRRTGCQVQPGK